MSDYAFKMGHKGSVIARIQESMVLRGGRRSIGRYNHMELKQGRTKKLAIFFLTFVFFYLCFLVFRYVMVDLLGCAYPVGDFRFFPDDRYKDFFTINQAAENLNPYLSKLSNYPPIILIFAYFFARMGDYSGYNQHTLRFAIENTEIMKSLYIFFAVYIVAFIAVIVYYGFILGREGAPVGKKGSKELTRYKVKQFLLAGLLGLALMLSAPSIYNFDRGNYLSVTIVLYMLWAIFEEQKEDSYMGAVFAALCAATKVYPIYILIMYFVEKKYKKLLVALATGAVVTLLPIFIFKGGYIENVREFVLGVIGFGGGDGKYSVYFTVGITGFVGYMYRLFGMVPNPRIVKFLWLAVGMVMTFGGFYFLRKEKTVWKKLLIVTAMMIYLMPNSFLYNSTYLFGPVLVMLGSREKMKRSDIPYIVICALLLVPKAYWYIPDLPIDMHVYFNTINCAVLFDSMLYFGMIFYYFAARLHEIHVRDHKLYLNRPIDPDAKIDGRWKTVFNIGICVAIAVVAATVIWIVRDTALSCHDSLEDFVKARLHGPLEGYRQGFEYGLARGRVGFIFPLVVMFRYLVNGSANYVAIWLLQYVPVFMNVGLLTYIIAKKFNKTFALFFPIFFLGLLQIDVWHSLIVCYPLDFMYGLFIAVLGAYLFESWMSDKASGKKGKKTLIKLIVSAFLYYESMQAYEAFIVMALIYAIIAGNYALKSSSAKLKDSLKPKLLYFVKALIPHFVVAVIYLAILVFIRTHPIVDTAVSNIGGTTEFRYFVLPYAVYSLGMFPMVDIRVLASVRDLFLHFSRRALIESAAAACALLAVTFISLVRYRSMAAEDRRREKRTLRVFLFCGIAFAMTFAIPHSLIPSYQEWVNVGHVGGYLPTTICYFGWSIALFSAYFLVLEFVAARGKMIRRCFTVGVTLIFFVAVFVTFGINVSFRNIETTSGTWTAHKARTFYDLLQNDEFKDKAIDILYVTGMSGIHNNIENNEELAEFELGRDIELVNEYEELPSLLKKEDSKVACYRYDSDAYAGLIIDAEDYNVYDKRWITDEPMYMVTSYEGDFMLVYRYKNGVLASLNVSCGTEGCYVDLGDDVAVNSIDIRRLR